MKNRRKKNDPRIFGLGEHYYYQIGSNKIDVQMYEGLDLREEFYWLHDAEFRNAIITLKVGDVVVWETGEWVDGTWVNGVWLEGYWHRGDWLNGSWRNGYWYRGNWHNGVWYNGVWKRGTWHYGMFCEGEWQSGTCFEELTGKIKTTLNKD